MNAIASNKLKTAEFYPFLTNTLRTEQLAVFAMAGDASARRYYRVVHKDDSWVLMCWEPFTDDGTYPFLSVLRHFQKHRVSVPEVIAMAPEEGLVLLEDLGDLTLERKFWESQSPEPALPFYHLALDQLLKIHFPASDDPGQCSAFAIQFDQDKFKWELNYARKHLLEGICQLKFEAKVSSELDLCFERISKLLDQEPKRLAHRDFHSRNIMIQLPSVVLIDFQDARMGPIQYDLVSLLEDSYVRLPQEIIEELKSYYINKAQSAYGHDIDSTHFNRCYDLQLVQRCFKACGSFASFYMQREDRRYLKYIEPTLKKISLTLNQFSEFKALKDVIDSPQVANFGFTKL